VNDKPPPPPLKGEAAALRDFVLGFPETTEDFPWGERAFKVRKKVFVFMGANDGIGLSVKLPQSREFALDYPFTEPTHYGLGRHGWVSARFAKGEALPLDLLRAWITESYRAVAPKTLAKMIAAPEQSPDSSPHRTEET